MTLEQRQKAGQQVERDLLEFLIQFDPTRELKVSDVVQIASVARRYAFEAFSEETQ